MSVIGAIHRWMNEKCTVLEQYRELFMDYLPEDTEGYSLEGVPAEPVVRRYVNGDMICRKVFAFSSTEVYDGIDNIDTADFYEDFANWMEHCTEDKNFPELPEGEEGMSIRATTDGYLYNENGKRCQYRIQCEFIYFKKRRI